MRFWCLFALVFLITTGVNSQVSRILIREEISLSGNLTNTMYGEVKLYMPVSGPNQLVLGRKFNVMPKQIIDKGDKLMAIWNVADVRYSRKITIETSLMLQNGSTVKSSIFGHENEENLAQYLNEEKVFPFNEKEIQDLVKQLKHSHPDSLIHEIIRKVKESFVYKKSPWHGVKLLKAIREKRGDCTEYAALMVALCRAKGIPARLVMGLMFQQTGEHHNWAEVYTAEKGWVSWDPLNYDVETFIFGPKNAYVAIGYDLQPRLFIGVPRGIEWKFEATQINNTQTVSDMAYLCFESGKYQMADSLYSILITELPLYFNNYNFLGISKARQNKFNEALPLLQQAMNLSKNEMEICYSLYAFANYAALKEDQDMVLKYLDRVLEKTCVSMKTILADPDFVALSQSDVFKKWLENRLNQDKNVK